jgi:plasmid maintenance system antidote protein VapI
MARRLGTLFGNAPDVWRDPPRNVDVWHAARSVTREVAHTQPLRST